MENAVRRIGVLTSGGDAPGMNAAIRAVVRTCTHLGIECVGIRRGFNGLINGDAEVMGYARVSGITRLGGTMLYSARSEEGRQYLQAPGAGRHRGHRRRRYLPGPSRLV